MKVALINTSENTGGAAIACRRLFEAHRSQGIEVTHIVLNGDEAKRDNKIVLNQQQSFSKWKLYMEKLQFWFHEKSDAYRFKFSTAQYGYDISKIKEVREADVIHLHWVQQGFLSLNNIEKLMQLGKPVYWTMHDMWTFTGGCHYSEDCVNFKSNCGDCFMLKKPAATDLSNKLWLLKERLYGNEGAISFITCSAWLKNIAHTSKLLAAQNVMAIPNPINTDFYVPAKKQIGKKYSILIQAMDLNDERKGFTYFIECLEILKSIDPTITERIKINSFGKLTDESISKMGYEVEAFGFLKTDKEVLAAYHASDILVIPSLQDNLPNAVMESLSCGIPVIGFETGGIPEMVDHLKNGYITEVKNSNGLAQGILWAIEDQSRFNELSANARKKVETEYSYPIISARYVDEYKKRLAENK